MSGTETVRWLPYHEGIMELLDDFTERHYRYSGQEVNLLARVLKRFAIPTGHFDEVAARWNRLIAERGESDDPYGVVEDLLTQKAEAEKKATEKVEEAAKPLFPPYLDQGSTGAAVNVLALLLKSGCYGDHDAIVLDGVYGPLIAEAVKDFQEGWSFEGADVDGNFGPKTRTAWKEANRIDVDELTVGMFTMPTVGKGPADADEEREEVAS